MRYARWCDSRDTFGGAWREQYNTRVTRMLGQIGMSIDLPGVHPHWLRRDAEAHMLGERDMLLLVTLRASGGSGHPIIVPAGKEPIGKVSKIIASCLPVGAICERIRRMRRFEGRSRNPPTMTTVRPSAVVAKHLRKRRAVATEAIDGKSRETSTL